MSSAPWDDPDWLDDVADVVDDCPPENTFELDELEDDPTDPYEF